MAATDAVTLDAIDRQLLGNFDVRGKLGEGSYGVVFRAVISSSGAEVAIKKLRMDGLSEGVQATCIREVTLLQELHHKYIVRLLDVIATKRRIYLVFELLAEDLRALIQRSVKSTGKGLPLSQIQLFSFQVLVALWYCHENRVLHRDLKPGNILVNGDGTQVKLADFGLARAFELPLCTYTHEVITLWYRAPEILLGEKHYTPAVDVWSVGCIVIEMAVGKSPFRGDSEATQLQKIFSVLGTPNELTWPGVTQLKRFTNFTVSNSVPMMSLCPMLGPDGCDFVSRALMCDPKQRATVDDLLAHPFLAAYATVGEAAAGAGHRREAS